VQKRSVIDDIKAQVEKVAQDVQKQAADAISEASSLWDEIKSKVSEVVSSASANLNAKAQEVKDKIKEVVSAAQQIGRNFGPCVSEQSEAADSVLKLAGTASRRFYEPFRVRSHFMPGILS
jgi:methyl-accepting chemotaxis protein